MGESVNQGSTDQEADQHFFFEKKRIQLKWMVTYWYFISRMATERTFIAIKPDGVQRGLVGEIIKRFEQRGYKLVAMKLCRPGKEHLEKHYADLSSKVNISAIPLDHINNYF